MCRCIGTRMSACTAASDDGRPLRARLAAGRATQQVGSGVQDSYPIHLNPICGARSNSSAADVVTAVIHSNETVPGERGNFHAGHSYTALTGLWRTATPPHRRQVRRFHRTTAREPLPSVDHNHACHSSQPQREPLPFVDHARCSPVKRYDHIRKETSSCNLYFRRLGIRETVPTRRLPP